MKAQWFFSILLVILCMVLSFIFLKYQMRPIERLKNYVDKIKDPYHHKNIDKKLESIKADDEISDLTKTLLTLSNEVMESNRLLEFQKKALDEAALVTITDEKGIITYVNKKFCETFGYQEDELIGKDHQIIKSPHHPEEFFENVLETMNKGLIWKGEMHNLAKDGTPYWMDQIIFPFKDKSGNITQFVFIKKDITLLKDQAKKLEDAMQAKSRFLAVMGHEIRTPLSTILGLLNIIKEKSLPSDAKRDLKTVENAGEILLEVVNNILDYSKLEAKKLTLENLIFNPQKIIKNVIDLFEQKAKEKGLELKFEVESLPKLVKGDVTRLKQVIMNLLSNAIKYTDEGIILIKAQLATSDINHHTIQISVKDTGIGISKKDQDRLFLSFEQIKSSDNRKFGGTGLGLAIVRGIAEAMGGKVWVQSDIGKGSTFFFNFKGGIVQEDEIKAMRTAKSNDEKLGKHFPLNILVADDSPPSLQIMEHLLSKLGHHGDYAHNGVEVLEKLKQKKYHVIFMDAQMPELDGYETTKIIRQKVPHESQPWVIGFTASIIENESEYCQQNQMDDHLSKPVNLKNLKTALIKLQEKKFSKRNV